MNSVCVLLAAYNGELYIEQQIDSILKQKGIEIHLFVSLDKSTDNTLSILTKYELTNSNVKILPYGDRFGAAAPNFYRLIKDVSFAQYDYIAFSDQDDIWELEKLSSAISELSNSGSQGFSSDVIAFWETGRSKLIKKSELQVKYDHFFESPGPGCTFVIKSDIAMLFKQRLEDFNHHKSIDYHDWLLYAFVRGRGLKWHISNLPLMKYRQHEANQIGANSGVVSIINRTKLISSGWYRNQINLTMEMSNYNGEIYQLVNEKSYLNNLKLMRHLKSLRRNKAQRIFLGIMLMLNLF